MAGPKTPKKTPKKVKGTPGKKTPAKKTPGKKLAKKSAKKSAKKPATKKTLIKENVPPPRKQQEPIEPPFSYKVNHRKNTVFVRVTLHRIPPKFINFQPTATSFELDTLKNTKRFKLSFPFPSGITVETDPEPEATLNYGILETELKVADWGTYKDKFKKKAKEEEEAKEGEEGAGEEGEEGDDKVMATKKKRKGHRNRGTKGKEARDKRKKAKTDGIGGEATEPEESSGKFLGKARMMQKIDQVASKSEAREQKMLAQDQSLAERIEAKETLRTDRREKKKGLKDKAHQAVRADMKKKKKEKKELAKFMSDDTE